MGITIDDVKEELISILTEIDMTGASMVTSAYKNELKVAISTMSKYQKIQEIVGNYGFDTSWECLRQIREVMEDGA